MIDAESWPRIWGYIFRGARVRGVPYADAEDLAGDVIVRALEQPPADVRREDAFWFIAGVRRAGDWWRREHRKVPLDEPPEDFDVGLIGCLISPDPLPEEVVEWAEVLRQVPPKIVRIVMQERPLSGAQRAMLCRWRRENAELSPFGHRGRRHGHDGRWATPWSSWRPGRRNREAET